MTLDEEIAEARAQRQKLKDMAAAGDPIAALVDRRLDEAEAEFLKAATDKIFHGA